jgi:hypothetical protein
MLSYFHFTFSWIHMLWGIPSQWRFFYYKRFGSTSPSAWCGWELICLFCFNASRQGRAPDLFSRPTSRLHNQYRVLYEYRFPPATRFLLSLDQNHRGPGSHKITRRPSTSRPPGPHLSSQPARQSVQSKFDTWGSMGESWDPLCTRRYQQPFV